jgi:site-specific DNA-methyltransferase (adenine-specific)
MMTSHTPEWSTPQDLFDRLNAEFDFRLDPCATDDNHKCAVWCTRQQNGLSLAWSDYSSVFMNPPYGREIGKWVRKAYEESQNGATVVCLLPARTDTAWWHDWCMKGEVRFLRGRLRFGGSKNSAPFPSAIVVFRPTERLLAITKGVMR